MKEEDRAREVLYAQVRSRGENEARCVINGEVTVGAALDAMLAFATPSPVIETEGSGTYAEFQQRRGRLPDLIEEAIEIHRGFMLDDDYDAHRCLDKIVAKLKDARDFYDPKTPAVELSTDREARADFAHPTSATAGSAADGLRERIELDREAVARGRAAVEELANVRMDLSLDRWCELSQSILAALSTREAVADDGWQAACSKMAALAADECDRNILLIDLISAARSYVSDALQAHEHSDGRDLLTRIDTALANKVLATAPDDITCAGPEGYKEAFYDIAKMLGIGARPLSPKEVWQHEMRPKLEAALLPARSEPVVDGAAEVREAIDPFCRVWAISFKPFDNGEGNGIASRAEDDGMAGALPTAWPTIGDLRRLAALGERLATTPDHVGRVETGKGEDE